jgi:hypoxanthine phosphoribosyltransferase|tara:strand:- start:1036 stop:1590 length:555 start_codon:yes stop_codon:yes gene_type:complete
MEREVPAAFQELHSEESVQQHVADLALVIEEYAAQVLKDTGTPLLALCILRGGFLFFSDLLKTCKISIEPAFVRCESYSSEVNAAQLDTIKTNYVGTDFHNRTILLVDDICDTGKTLRHLAEDILTNRGARSVKSVTMVYRNRADSVFKPDWHAFAYGGEEWLVGYGMEDRNCYMNYPALYKFS